MFMKSIAKQVVAGVLGWQVRRLAKKNDFKVVAVAGSVGKTSTKLAIANVLSAGLRVRFQDGNYNDLVSVPLIFFGRSLPSLFNPLAWLAIFIKNEIQMLGSYPYDVVVVELGSDGPGQIKQFQKYLRVEIGVLTAIVPEHMEYFGNLDAVAQEETAMAEFSTLNLVNADMCPPEYLSGIAGHLTYAINTNTDADFKLANLKFNDDGCSFDVLDSGTKILSAKHAAFSEPQLYSVLAAVAVAYKLGLDEQAIQEGLAKIHPVPGRMQILPGVNDSKIIDDTYNSSPEAVKAALKTLYRMNAPQKIAILGNMNELGEFSKAAHQQIGQQCEPAQLSLVVTIGPDANKYLAPGAKAKGCNVKIFDNPYDAGEFVKSQIKPGALVLAKGSQNKVFAEETVKLLLANPADVSKLVRQSKTWLKTKDACFKK